MTDSADAREKLGQPGIGVDQFGGQVTDPTKNVEDLVEAKSKSDDILRKENQRFFDAQIQSLAKFSDFAREAEARIQVARTDAETRRIDQLAETRQEFQNTIRDMLAESVRTTSTLVSTQLVQIQATFDTRVSKLEAQAFTAAGRSSVADPAIESAMTRMSKGISDLSVMSAEAMNKQAAANSEAMAKLTATMATMQTSAAAATGERGGVDKATAAQIVTETLRLQGSSVQHSGNQNMYNIISIIVVILIATVGWVMSSRQATVIERGAHPTVYLQRI
jgi:cobalamin biosynthesis Mg chelatase CobN